MGNFIKNNKQKKRMSYRLPVIHLLIYAVSISLSLVRADQPAYEITIEETVDISDMAGGMMNLLRHPDGTLWLNIQSGDLAKTLVHSSDEGKTWKPVPIHWSGVQPDQFPNGFGISRDGRLWILHQQKPGDQGHAYKGRKLYVSVSADHGGSWQTTEIDFHSLAPGGRADPYKTANTAHAYNNFIEDANGTLMFSTSLRYADWADWKQEDQGRPGIRDVMVRSHDGGQTWDDATIVHQHATETDHAVNPANPMHLLSATRKQRMILRGEQRAQAEKEALIEGTPHIGTPYVWKGGLLLESMDGGRTFQEIPHSYTGFYGHRANILWTKSNVVIFSHCIGKSVDTDLPSPSHVARISLDGGKTWLAKEGGVTSRVDQSKAFLFCRGDQTVTIDVSGGRYFTAIRNPPVRGFFWRLTSREN